MSKKNEMTHRHGDVGIQPCSAPPRKEREPRRLTMTVLRKTREAAGLSQSQFARAAGLYATTVSRLEHAKEKAGPTLRARISTALQTEEAALFAADGWPILTEAEAVC